ncbi:MULTISPECIES: hypothetical protein [unclassified Mesorhizobium]|uniref:hypothetical protein n=1 Tax=unclassified Mesorhizobium TaxID=325217 RepID=UPI0033387707
MKTEIYFIRAIGKRGEQLLEAVDRNGYFAEAVDDDLHRRGGPSLPCLMSFKNGRITHFGSLFVGNKAAEGSKRVNVRDLRRLDTEIRTAHLVELISPRFQRRVQERLRSSGLIADEAATILTEAIRSLNPSLARQIERFAQDWGRINALSRREKHALAVEKEMVAAALSFAGIDRDELRDWSLPHRPGSSFLDGLPQVRLREDAMVMNDMTNVPGFEYVRTVARSAAVFENGNTRLTVVLANHLAIEEQLGGDLIYYNETLGAFTIIQYKAMEMGENNTAIFRLPDRKLSEEIGRMKVHLGALQSCRPNDLPEGFRLLENPFFIKLCPRIDFEAGETGLIKGMYLPLDFWNLLEADSRKVGSRGGRLITFENVGRYFDNTSFISLVANGWIGTSIYQSALLRPIVRDLVETGRPFTVAVAADTTGVQPWSSPRAGLIDPAQ